jgi:ferrous iron transport protein A
MQIDLTKLKPGEHATVVKVEGGYGAVRRIHSLGIREGKRVIKISSHFWGGPQIVRIGHSRVAIGFGMARKIIVEAENEKAK